MDLSWENLSYGVGKVQILSNLSGRLDAGNMLAVVGPSGSGKTSLLNILAKLTRATAGSYNCQHETGRMGYVYQVDVFLRHLTVREHLTYQYQLEHPYDLPVIQAKIVELAKQFRLTGCLDNIIGCADKTAGISGGERRRLAIASEMLREPKLLFLDEPTSGLDQNGAEQILRLLQQLNQDTGTTIVCTIHQPPPLVTEVFTHLLVLRYGYQSYWGIPVSDQLHANSSDIRIEMSVRQDTSESATHTSQLTGRPTWTSQLRCLISRNYRENYRNPTVFRAKIGQNLFIALLTGGLYYQLGITQADVQNRNGAVFFVLENLVFGTSFTVLRAFSYDLQLFKREYQKGIYPLSSYFIAKTGADLIYQLFLVLLLIIPIYLLVNFNTHLVTALQSIGHYILFAMCGYSWGYFIASLSSREEIGVILNPVLLLPQVLVSGFLINAGSIPVGLKWLQDFSFIRYAFENLMILEWDRPKETLYCASNEACRFYNGTSVLTYLNIDTDNYYRNLWCLISLTVGFRVLAYLVIKYQVRKVKVW